MWRKPHRSEMLRANVNQAPAFPGTAVPETGALVPATCVETILEAQRRADELRADLTRRGVHPDVLRFCRAELVADNDSMPVLEATKSVVDKLRAKAGINEDGGKLVDIALRGSAPRLAINGLLNESQRSEQSGFAKLVKGMFGVFRNPTAHEARILRAMNMEDAEDLLSIVSLVHRRLDAAR